jgi:hypothetical protein
MARQQYSPQEAVRRARDWYERTIREEVEPAEMGRYLMVDVDTGAYRVGDDYHALAREMLMLNPDAPLCALRVGYRAVGRIGSAGTRERC